MKRESILGGGKGKSKAAQHEGREGEGQRGGLAGVRPVVSILLKLQHQLP